MPHTPSQTLVFLSLLSVYVICPLVRLDSRGHVRPNLITLDGLGPAMQITEIPMTPLHPLVVHLPLALAVVVPVLAIGALLYAWRRGLSRRAWAIVFLLQAGLVVGGFAALSTGDADEDRVEQVVAESAIERHEESGERFVWASTGVLGLMLLPLLTGRREGLRRVAAGVATAGSVATAALAVDTGHKGGELVYEHGAALAYVNTDAASVPEHATGALEAVRGRLADLGAAPGDDDDDDDD